MVIIVVGAYVWVCEWICEMWKGLIFEGWGGWIGYKLSLINRVRLILNCILFG